MSDLIYAKDHRLVGVVANELTPVDFPSRSIIRQISIHHEAGTQHEVTLYNRALVGDEVSLRQIVDDGDGNTLLEFAEEFPAALNDMITVQNTSVAGYNVAHRVVERRSFVKIVTDQAYTSDASGGEAFIDFPDAMHHLYQLAPPISSDASGNIFAYPPDDDRGIVFFNQDPQRGHSSTNRRRLYLKFNQPGDYRVSIQAQVKW